MLLLGLPTVLLGFVVPDVVVTHRAMFFVAYIVNYVVESYLIGDWAGRFFCRSPLPPASSA